MSRPVFPPTLAVPGALVLALAGCAGSAPTGEALLGPAAIYTLSAEEQGLDCSRLTGRIQVRLLALRGSEFKAAPSGTAEAMRSATSTAFGTDTAANAAVRAARDRPVLEAYNRRLAELGCPSFDLDKELAARPSAPTPAPSIPAAAKTKTKS